MGELRRQLEERQILQREEEVSGRGSDTKTHRLAAVQLAPLLVLHALWPAPSFSQDAASPRFQQEIMKQEGIYQSQGDKIPGGYITSRGLEKYKGLLPSGFDAALKRLGPADRWLDIGAGAGHAVLDYYSPEYGRSRFATKAAAVALSIEDRRTDLWQKRAATLAPGQIRYLSGKRLREYSNEELGRFRLITDVYGGFSYTEHLSLFTEKVLALLEANGSFYTLLMSVHLEHGKDRPRTWYLTEIVDAAGRDIRVCSWLKSIACVRVACESKNGPEWQAQTELIHVRKVCNKISVPALEAVSYEAGSPPGRKFRLRQ
jgi:hypothetical protein